MFAPPKGTTVNVSDLPGLREVISLDHPALIILAVLTCLALFGALVTLSVALKMDEVNVDAYLVAALVITFGLALVTGQVATKTVDTEGAQALNDYVSTTYGIENPGITTADDLEDGITITDGSQVYSLTSTSDGRILLVDFAGHEVKHR